MTSDVRSLQDVLDAINQIEKYTNRSAFDTSELIQVWMIYHHQIIGEASEKSLMKFVNNILKFRGFR